MDDTLVGTPDPEPEDTKAQIEKIHTDWLTQPQEPITPPVGMSSDALSQYVLEFASFCMARVTGPGKDQYDHGGSQKFEALSPDQLLDELAEELADVGNYAAMLFIRVRRVQAALRDVL
jgi:hypothetical protein